MFNKDYHTLIYASFCGSGKTYINENVDIESIEIEYWKYIESGTQDKYVTDVKSNIGKVDFIFISTDPEGLRLLNKEGLSLILVYPENSLRNEYLDRYINMDNTYDFIGMFMKNWNIWINELKEQKYCKHIVLKSGEYLTDII